MQSRPSGPYKGVLVSSHRLTGANISIYQEKLPFPSLERFDLKIFKYGTTNKIKD